MTITLALAAFLIAAAAYGVGYDHGRGAEREASDAEALSRALDGALRRLRPPRTPRHANN